MCCQQGVRRRSEDERPEEAMRRNSGEETVIDYCIRWFAANKNVGGPEYFVFIGPRISSGVPESGLLSCPEALYRLTASLPNASVTNIEIPYIQILIHGVMSDSNEVSRHPMVHLIRFITGKKKKRKYFDFVKYTTCTLHSHL